MDIKNILNNLDTFDLRDVEIADIDLTEFEKERVRRNLKNTIRSKRNKNYRKSIMAASLFLGILVFGTVNTSVIASNNSIFTTITKAYRHLGIFKGVENYTKFIGVTRENNGYKVTIENLIVTPNKIITSIRVATPISLRDDGYHCNINTSYNTESLNCKFINNGEIRYDIDENNFLLISEIETIDEYFPCEGELGIKVFEDYNDKSNKKMSVDFNFNIDFKSSCSKFIKFDINDSLNKNIKVDKLESSILSTNIFVKSFSKKFDLEKYIKEKDVKGMLNLFIDVDGVLHSYKKLDIDENRAMISFPTLKYDEIKKAKRINIVYNVLDEDLYDRQQDYSNIANENGIKYPRIIKSNSGREIRLYKAEKGKDNVKFYLSSDEIPINLLKNLRVFEFGGETIVLDKMGLCYKNEEEKNSYIIEFKDINVTKNIELIYWDSNNNFDKVIESKTIRVR